MLREDYLAAFGELASILPEGTSTRYRLQLLRKPAAIQAVKRPLEGTQWSFAEGVAEQLVDQMMLITVQKPSGEPEKVLGEFAELVQLQVVCYSLIESLPPETTEITKEMLERFADAENALQSFYDKVVEKAATAGAVTERELRLWFEKHLITPAGTRGIVFQDQDHTGGIPNDVVESLADQHLIRPQFRSGSRWYELAHDGFVRPILRSNLAWGKKEKASEISDKEIARWERSITPLSKFWVYLPEFLGREESPNFGIFVEVMAHNSRRSTPNIYTLWKPRRI